MPLRDRALRDTTGGPSSPAAARARPPHRRRPDRRWSGRRRTGGRRPRCRRPRCRLARCPRRGSRRARCWLGRADARPGEERAHPLRAPGRTDPGRHTGGPGGPVLRRRCRGRGHWAASPRTRRALQAVPGPYRLPAEGDRPGHRGRRRRPQPAGRHHTRPRRGERLGQVHAGPSRPSPDRPDRRLDRARRPGHHHPLGASPPAQPPGHADDLPGPLLLARPPPEHRRDRG